MFVIKEDKEKREKGNQSPNYIAKSVGKEHDRNGKCKW